MGALKLTYRSDETALKVVNRFFSGEEKSCAESYRYGFNGQERDDELSGSGNAYNTEFRGYDTRLGRWKSLDPVVHHNMSPYNGFDNNPIYFIDPLGSNSSGYTVDKKGKIEKVDDTGGDKYDVLYSKSDYEAAKNSGITNSQGNPEPENQVKVNDTKILNALTQKHSQMRQVDYFDPGSYTRSYDPKSGEFNYKYNLNYLQGYIAFTNSENDARNVFEFAASNSSVEWTLEGSRAGRWGIGTLGEGSQALSMSYISGYKDNNWPIIQVFESFTVGNKIYDAHSHPDSDPKKDFNPSNLDINNANKARDKNPSIKYQLFRPKHPTKKWKSY